MSRVLYISYDGMLEPLGRSQVLGYLRELSATHEIGLISFEKPEYRRDRQQVEALQVEMKTLGIRWRPLNYHRNPSVPATLFDIIIGTLTAITMALSGRYRIIHARSYVPALMALVVKRLTGAAFLFDMRGFWADERIDGRIWAPGSRVYRAVKALERRFLRAADHIVTLTHRSIPAFKDLSDVPVDSGRVSVIPTCANLDLFSLPSSPSSGPFVLGYTGSIGTWYLFDELLQLFLAVKQKRGDARLLIVTRDDHESVQQRCLEAGLSGSDVELTAATHKEVPALVQRMTAATALIKPCFSKLSSSPTKLAEYLGCGVPCVGNVDVGDVADILIDHQVGVVVQRFDAQALDEAADELLALTADPELAERCRNAAMEIFSLEQGVAAYDRIYRAIG